MKNKKYFRYYRSNQGDKKRKHSDCAIEALSKILKLDWPEVFDLVAPFEKEELCLISDFTLDQYIRTYRNFNLKYIAIKKEEQARPNVIAFIQSHPKGRYILKFANRQAAVVNGLYYDSYNYWDTPIHGYWVFNENQVKVVKQYEKQK